MPVGKRPPEKGRSSDGVVLPREEPSAGSIFHAPEFDPARVNRTPRKHNPPEPFRSEEQSRVDLWYSAMGARILEFLAAQTEPT
jgi:hypothetical protein